jgi:hypothetical protein
LLRILERPKLRSIDSQSLRGRHGRSQRHPRTWLLSLGKSIPLNLRDQSDKTHQHQHAPEGPRTQHPISDFHGSSLSFPDISAASSNPQIDSSRMR